MAEKEKKRKISAIPGFAVLGCMITGLLGLKHAFNTGDGLGIIGAALAFGVVVHTCFKR